MRYGFDTEDLTDATGALVVYAIYRSRDLRRYKVTPDIWEQITRFVKAAATRSTDIPEFISKLAPRLHCGAIKPKWMAVGIKGAIPMIETEAGMRIQLNADEDQREFLTGVLESVEHKAVLKRLYKTPEWIVMLVRDRLEREKPAEQRFAAAFRDDDEEE